MESSNLISETTLSTSTTLASSDDTTDTTNSETNTSNSETDASNTETDASNDETESVGEATCADLNNGHVYAFLKSIGPTKTAHELLSYERCPDALTNYAFGRSLRKLKDDYVQLQKRRYKNQICAEEFTSFRDAPYCYPEPAEKPQKTVNEYEVKRVGDPETNAKVVFEIGVELNQEKTCREQESNRAKRKIESLQVQVEETIDENISLNDELAAKNADYKRLVISKDKISKKENKKERKKKERKGKKERK